MEKLEKTSQKQIVKVLLSTITGNLGSNILAFVIGLLILRETNSALNFGISQMIGPIVALLLLPVTGSMVDRFNRKLIIVYAQLLSMVSLAVYAVVIYFQGFEHLIYTYLLLIMLKVADQFLTTAFTASVLHIVITEHIQKLKSIQQGVTALIMIIAPIFGALLYNLIPLTAFVLIEIGIECLTLIIVLWINFDLTRGSGESHEETASGSFFEMFKEGLQFMAKSRKLIFTMVFSMIINFMAGAIHVGLPFLQIQVLHFSNSVYGIVEALFSVGMIASSIVLSASKEIKTPLAYSWKMTNAIGLLLVLLGCSLFFAFSQGYYIAFVAIYSFLTGAFITLVNVPISIWMTKEIPMQFQGRVFNILGTGGQLLMPLGILLFSGLFDHFSPAMIFTIAGSCLLIFTLCYPFVFKVNMKESKLLD
ncbi:MFS transporter [Listeria kieliensis]